MQTRYALRAMTQPPFPSLFVSHGAPTMVLTDPPARTFMQELGASLPRPKAILCVSAHWETDIPTLSGTPSPKTIHDFYGFPDALYQIRYEPPGSPALAERAAPLLRDSGLEAAIDPDRGLDHGAWTPLLLMYPKADIPTIQCSLQFQRGGAGAIELGRALAPLRDEGVLILGSGGAVHNLRQIRPAGAETPDWAARFDDWLADIAATGDAERLRTYRETNSDGTAAHARDEHLLPFAVALGAGGKGQPLHRGFMYGSLSMAAYTFA